MKRLTQIALVAAVAAMAASPALAQQQRRGGFGGFGGGGVLGLLSRKPVQEELKMSDEQVKKATEASAKQSEARQGLRDLSQEERRTKMQEMAKASDKAAAEILKPEQLKRAKQISLQVQGTMAFSNEEVAKTLSISDEQKEKIREVRMKSFEEFRGLGQDEDAAKKRQEIMKASNEKVMAVLTAEQKTKFKEMQGEPFKRLDELRRPGGGRQSRQR